MTASNRLKKFHSFPILHFFFFFSSLSMLLVSCENEESNVGIDFVERDSLIFNVIDSLQVITTDFLPETFIGNEADTSHRTCGSFVDPVFGQVTASFAFELNPFRIGAIPDSIIYDSIILQLSISGYYGDESFNQSIEIYELENLLPNGDIPSDYDVPYVNQPIGTKSYKPNSKTIHIKLDDAYGSRIFDILKDTANYKKDTSKIDEIDSKLKGLYVKPPQTEKLGAGAITYFNFKDVSSQSILFLFGHAIVNADSVSKREYFIGNNPNYAARANFYKHDNTVLNSLIGNSESLLYFQGFNGPKIQFTIPGLDQLKEELKGQNVVVNLAEISFPIHDPDKNIKALPNPDFMTIKRLEGYEYIVDQQQILRTNFGYASYLGGYPANQSYTFNITREVQNIITDSIPNEAYVLLPSNGSRYYYPALASRTILENSEANPVKFRIIYTSFFDDNDD